MPITASVKSSRASNLCLQCNEPVRGSKRFCSDEEKIAWLESHQPWHPDWRGAVQVENERKQRGITPLALEWKGKLNASRAF